MSASIRWLLVVVPLVVGSHAFSNGNTFATFPSNLPTRSYHDKFSTYKSNALTTSPLAIALRTRGGALDASSSHALSELATASTTALRNWRSTPAHLFNTAFLALTLITIAAKLLQRRTGSKTDGETSSQTNLITPAVQSLQRRFLPVFWILRCADWLQGPYFYEVYASKVFNGVSASLGLISQLFLTGFASTALFGPLVGRACDTYGRKKATLAFTLVYAAGALSTKSSLLQVLLLGRVLSGIGTCLLFSAPEAWLVAESQQKGGGAALGATFGLAYAGDAIVAILAGKLAAGAAQARGPTGPFELSTAFLALGGILTAFLWSENRAQQEENAKSTTIREALQVISKDPKILLVGATQSLFEAAMYIFVLQWPPAMAGGIKQFFGAKASATIPFGTIFSCFMACCLLGSTTFGQFTSAWGMPTEQFTCGMLGLATAAMSVAAWTVLKGSSLLSSPLAVLTAAFFLFEACVGMYFPSIGTLRSRFVPDSHRSVIMNLFGIPLNVLVVSVFLSIDKLGVGGALSVSAAALGCATACMFGLRRMVWREDNRVADFQI